MRVLQIYSRFLDPRCGVGQCTIWLCDELAKSGVDVSVLTTQQPAGSCFSLPVNGLDILPEVSHWRMSALPGMVRRIRSLNPDVVHLQFVHHAYGRHGIVTGIALLPSLIRSVLHIPVVITSHELYVPWGRLKQSVVSAWERATTSLLIASSNVFVTTVEAWMRVLARLLPISKKKVMHIPVGSTCPVFEISNCERERLRRELGVGDKEMLLMHFGQLNPGKQHHQIFKCLADLRQSGVEAKLLWAGEEPNGENPYHQHVRAAYEKSGVNGCVIWKGAYSGHSRKDLERLSHYLQAVNSCILTYADGVSERRTTFMSCLQHGTPVVTHFGEATSASLRSLPVFALEETCLAQAVRRSLNSNRETLSARMRCIYERQFSWKKVARRYRDVYEGVIGK